MKECQAELQDKAKKLAVLEREYTLTKTENADQKSILEQYEERFAQVKKHVEQLNSEK